MKILLIGDYSGLYYTLALGLKALGHQVTLASDGDGWKNYPRDVDLMWKKNRWTNIIKSLLRDFRQMKNYDVVQLINPTFVSLRPFNVKFIYKYLKDNNESVFLGANGSDFYYQNFALRGRYKTSIFNQKHLLGEDFIKRSIERKSLPSFINLNRFIAETCDGITACCTEYKLAYDELYMDKTAFIPLPIKSEDYGFINAVNYTKKLNFFLGIQEVRQTLKGMDVLYDALLDLKNRHPNDVELTIAKSVPFEEYKTMLDSSHILCDQLYSYGNGMNGVMAMTKGLIVAGGGEEEMYNLFGETENKPIINLPDTKEEIVAILESLLERREELPDLSRKSREFALKHHDYIKVAQQYVDFWKSKIL